MRDFVEWVNEVERRPTLNVNSTLPWPEVPGQIKRGHQAKHQEEEEMRKKKPKRTRKSGEEEEKGRWRGR